MNLITSVIFRHAISYRSIRQNERVIPLSMSRCRRRRKRLDTRACGSSFRWISVLRIRIKSRYADRSIRSHCLERSQQLVANDEREKTKNCLNFTSAGDTPIRRLINDRLDIDVIRRFFSRLSVMRRMMTRISSHRLSFTRCF